MSTRCFLVVPTARERLYLRRYKVRDGTGCPASGNHYHDADVLIGEQPRTGEAIGDDHPHDDPRWPKACGCGYEFRPDDAWQLFRREIYVRADDPNAEVTLSDRLPGMMWLAPWYWDPAKGDENRMRRGGAHLSPHYWRDHAGTRPPIVVCCPNGREWMVDAKSTNGDGWKVTGEPPTITCAPSIAVPGYHGFLRDGVFTEDVEGRGPNGTAG